VCPISNDGALCLAWLLGAFSLQFTAAASSRGARIRAIHGSEVNFSARWASHPMTLKYSNDDLRSLYFEFEKYAEGGEMNVDNFERMVVEKNRALPVVRQSRSHDFDGILVG
jgi:hypothetical protein